MARQRRPPHLPLKQYHHSINTEPHAQASRSNVRTPMYLLAMANTKPSFEKSRDFIGEVGVCLEAQGRIHW